MSIGPVQSGRIRHPLKARAADGAPCKGLYGFLTEFSYFLSNADKREKVGSLNLPRPII